MLLGSSFGEKRTPFLVLKTAPSKIAETQADNNRLRHGFGKVLWKTIERLQRDHGVQIYGNKCGWWNSRLSVIWLDYHFKDREQPELPIVLLWDRFSGHWSPDVVTHAQSINVHLVDVPAGHTSVCQPADIAWNRPLKQRLRRHWVQRLADQLAAGGPGAAALKAPTRDEVVGWVAASWCDMATSTIANGFTGIMRQPANTVEIDAEFNAVADQLENLNLLDCVVECNEDIVDRILAGEDTEITEATV
jgi:hypothetical protein